VISKGTDRPLSKLEKPPSSSPVGPAQTGFGGTLNKNQLEVPILQIFPAAHSGVPVSWSVAHQFYPCSLFLKGEGPTGKPDQFQGHSLQHCPGLHNLMETQMVLQQFSKHMVSTGHIRLNKLFFY